MSEPIIEYIGKNGVISNPEIRRLYMPKPGDVIDFGEFEGTYPFTSGKFGRIDSETTLLYDDTDVLSVCCGNASVFWCNKDTVSISGGPFGAVHKNWLDFIGLKKVGFWNWGDNNPGADQGVHYWITRPLFLLSKYNEKELA